MGRTSGKAPALRIALVGTRGIPACYGGFETCVEEVGQRLASAGTTWWSIAGEGSPKVKPPNTTWA